MCNGCFAVEKMYDHERIFKCAEYDFARYKRKVAEASSPSKFTESEIAEFYCKVRNTAKELEETNSNYAWYDWCNHEGSEYASDRKYMREHENDYKMYSEPMIQKMKDHWIWNYSHTANTVSHVSKTNDNFDDNVKKYINRFKNTQDPVQEAIKYREEYKKNCAETEDRLKFYENEYKNAKNFPSQKYANDKIIEKKELISSMVKNIASLKTVITYFLKN